jgi:hypothetical protein
MRFAGLIERPPHPVLPPPSGRGRQLVRSCPFSRVEEKFIYSIVLLIPLRRNALRAPSCFVWIDVNSAST